MISSLSVFLNSKIKSCVLLPFLSLPWVYNYYCKIISDDHERGSQIWSCVGTISLRKQTNCFKKFSGFNRPWTAELLGISKFDYWLVINIHRVYQRKNIYIHTAKTACFHFDVFYLLIMLVKKKTTYVHNTKAVNLPWQLCVSHIDSAEWLLSAFKPIA